MAKRITDYPEETVISGSDYILLDGPQGTRKIQATMLGNGNVTSLTQAQYDALSSDEKTNGTVYLIANSKIMYLGNSYIKQ